eukprot:12917968-Prorocentrum_lima.AAC.1
MWFQNIWEGDPLYEEPEQRLCLRRHEDNANFEALSAADGFSAPPPSRKRPMPNRTRCIPGPS